MPAAHIVAASVLLLTSNPINKVERAARTGGPATA